MNAHGRAYLAAALGVVAFVLAGRPVAAQDTEAARKRLEALEARQAEQRRLFEQQDREIDELRALLGIEPVGEADPFARRAGASPFALPGAWRRLGDTQVTPFDLGDVLTVGFGVQYRVMYNASNIPGPGGSTFQSTDSYDFLRQRMRLNLAVAPKDARVGGFVQLEFRGGFGGSSPRVSDPRLLEPTLNPFNNLEARGVRFGYVFAEFAKDHRLLAGILPVSDGFDDTLFSADWDFSVGGVALLGATESSSYRVGYLRLLDGIGSSDPATVAEDGALILGDYVFVLEWGSVGLHAYYLHVGERLPLGDTDSLWAGPSFETTVGGVRLRAFGIVNVGRLGIGVLDAQGRVASGFDRNDGHLGFALKAAGSGTIGNVDLAVQALFATGDRGGEVQNRFTTPQGLFGTSGYWGFTHVFTANPPSDVNDLAIDLGNGGAGLLTVQGRAIAPIADWLTAEVSAGWFRSHRSRSGSQRMGFEAGGVLSILQEAGFRFDVGCAGAFTEAFFGRKAGNLYEVFARMQFQF